MPFPFGTRQFTFHVADCTFEIFSYTDSTGLINGYVALHADACSYLFKYIIAREREREQGNP
jgi:hypothetical protein